MILLTPQFCENFENNDKRDVSTVDMKQGRDCYDVSFNDDCSKLYNQEYIEVFSPTVFETVEVYTSASSDQSDNTDFSDAILPEPDTSTSSAGIGLDGLDAVTSLEDLEPGTYTLDVLQSADFDFDSVFVNSQSNLNIEKPADVVNACSNENSTPAAKNTVVPKKSKISDAEGIKKAYKLKSCKSSSRKPPSPKYSSTRNLNAREFLNNFSNDLRKTEETASKLEEESRSLSWLLDFKISSIFNPVECDADTSTEKVKKKSNDSQKKPRYTYTELIEQALKENGELTVSGIYNWISNHYPYYQQHDDRWKNSVRHNLSINPQFRKGKKASQGAGHFWNISETVSQSSELNNNKINNMLPRISMESTYRERDMSRMIPDSVTDLIDQIDEEVLAATKSIQENESMNFTDVSLHDAVAHHVHIDGKHSTSSIHISRNDIEQLWESTNENADHRFSSFSPLIREITEESSSMEEENFLIEDIHNSICLGDELFSNGLSSPYYGLTTI